MLKQKNRKNRFAHWKWIAVLLLFFDVVAVNLSYFAALWLRFDCRISAIQPEFMEACLRFMPINTLLCLVVFFWQRLYHSIWRFASFDELFRVLIATVVTALLHIVGIGAVCSQITGQPMARMPITYYLIGAGLQFMLTLGIRFSYRFVLLMRNRRRENKGTRVMLVGAGGAGQMILKSVREQPDSGLQIVCIIDDNCNKWSRRIMGIPVVGGREDIIRKAEEYRVGKIFVAIPSAEEEDHREILNICKETGCELKNLPGIEQIVSDDVSVNDLKDVAVEDLLGRDPIHVNMDAIYDYVSGKTILVTGGGGSIGSELCRQVAAHNPKKLIIFEVYENSAYEIQQELRTEHPEVDLVVRIGSVRDSRCLDRVFEEYKPDLVYHAAAHKHVPLMEDSPCEAIKNNVIGTYKTAYAAMVHGCKRFVLISTDKAVNPTNIMGASKRLCEMVIQSFDKAVKTKTADKLPRLYTHYDSQYEQNKELELPADIQTEYVAVRFGNVLGSNGSVIPLFKKQIQAGGPVTVTHPDIIRYFMTIPEAVSLVMQAGTYADGGNIFVLDMGAPVKIDDLARNLIKLSGLRPDKDIKIQYTGLRPGEKLYEEKLMAEEGMQKTDNDLIHIGNPIPLDTDVFLEQLKALMKAAYENDDAIRDAVEEMVPTYHPEAKGRKDETYKSLYRQTQAVY